MKKIIIALSLVIIACNSGKGKDNQLPPKEGVSKVFAVYTDSKGNKIASIVLRVIEKKVIYDSATKTDRVGYDTIWGIPTNIPILDSVTNKPKLDSLGYVIYRPEPAYYRIGKDSVNTHVENIPLDSLLKK